MTGLKVQSKHRFPNTGSWTASQSKKGQSKTKSTSCVSKWQDGNQARRMTEERTQRGYKLQVFCLFLVIITLISDW